VAPVGRAFGRRSPLATLAVGLGELVALGAAEVLLTAALREAGAVLAG